MKSTTGEGLGEIFVRLEREFDICARYCANHGNAMNLMMEVSKSLEVSRLHPQIIFTHFCRVFRQQEPLSTERLRTT